jgi:outer membrane receptor protein involved in Fe transport
VNPLDLGGRQIDDSQAGQGDCQFFVPGGASFTNPALANDQDVINTFTGRLKEQTTTGLWVIDGVLSGSLIDLPAGPVGLAVGYQFRRESYDVSRNRESTRTDRFIFLAGGSEFNSDRSTTALFSELNIPVRDDLEVQAAIRFEDYNGSIGSSVDPKLGFRWQPQEWIGVRGSFSTTFRAPTLNQQRSERTENELIRDVFNTGFLPIDNRGNQFLKPEEADVYNFGVQLKPTERLNATLDYFRIDFSDLVVSENAQSLVAAENAANGARAGKCTDPNFVASAQITRDPLTLNSAGVCGISRIEARFVNQNSVITDGVDLGVTYDMDVAGFDAFRLSTNVTHLIQYDIKTDAGTIHGAGQRNESNFARALPKWRANAGVSGQMGVHSGGFTVRYTSSYEDDDRVRGSGFGSRIDDHTTVDAFYAYDLQRFDATLQVGVIDLFNREPPFVNTDFNFDSRTADARGRRVYANLTVRY